MRVTPPVPINAVNLTSSSASAIHTPGVWAAGSTYAYGALVSGVITGATTTSSGTGDFSIYESLQDGNIGKTPATEPFWWRKIGGTETLWSATVTYVLGATASGANGRVYESLQAANLNKALPVLPETLNDWWQDVGPTNKWAMFDSASNTQTVRASPLTVVFKPGMRINTIGITGLSANSLTITANSAVYGGVVYGPKVVDLNLRTVLNAYDYAFKRFETQPSLAYFDLPPFSDMEITVTISATSGNVKCGAIIVGTYVYLGDAVYGARGDALNFSTIDRDIYGNAILVPRRSVPKTNQTLSVDSSKVNSIRAARAELNAVPALWTGLDDGASDWFDMLLIVGVYKQFEITAESHSRATVQLEIEEI